MPRMGFEPTIPAFEGVKTVHVLRPRGHYEWLTIKKFQFVNQHKVTYYEGRAIAHAVSRWLPTSGARVQTQV
jgi:hypothetical protein